MLFTLCNFLWNSLWLFYRIFGKISHPISQSFVFRTTTEAAAVIIVPTFWDNYSYIVTSGSDAISIDPSQSEPIFREIKKRKLHLSAIVVTHEHVDHVAGIRKLAKKCGAPIYVPDGATIPGKAIHITNGYTLQLGALSLKAVFVPGHFAFPYPLASLNRNIAWYCAQEGLLFTGDTLFSCGYGYTARGHEDAMSESLKLLRSFPDDTKIFSGHEYSLRLTESVAGVFPDNKALIKRLSEVRRLLAGNKPTVPTTMGLEKAINPWLRWDDENCLRILKFSRLHP
jgi:hydroxyacylglutathione hydrolase